MRKKLLGFLSRRTTKPLRNSIARKGAECVLRGIDHQNQEGRPHAFISDPIILIWVSYERSILYLSIDVLKPDLPWRNTKQQSIKDKLVVKPLPDFEFFGQSRQMTSYQNFFNFRPNLIRFHVLYQESLLLILANLNFGCAKPTPVNGWSKYGDPERICDHHLVETSKLVNYI